ncbi:hypothetical protein HMI54_008365, partial [Coelomomyces lativittatus]
LAECIADLQVLHTPVTDKNISKAPTTTFSSLFSDSISPQIEKLVQTILGNDAPIIHNIDISTSEGHLIAVLDLESKSFYKILKHLVHFKSMSFDLLFNGQKWIEFQTQLKAMKEKESRLIRIVVKVRLIKSSALEVAFKKASHQLWTTNDPQHQSKNTLYSISVSNIVLGEWKICGLDCIQIFMNEWYAMYQGLREQISKNKKPNTIKIQRETPFFKSFLKKVESILKGTYDLSMTAISKIVQGYHAAHNFIKKDSIVIPLKFPFPINMDFLSEVGVEFSLASKDGEELTRISIDSILQTKLKTGKEAILLKFNPKSKSLPKLGKLAISVRKIEQITRIVFKINDKKFPFLNGVRIQI